MKCESCKGRKIVDNHTCQSCLGFGFMTHSPSESLIAAVSVIEQLLEYTPYLYSQSKDRNSFYIHFKNLPNGCSHKLRISNHPERSRYGYKWQLRIDNVTEKEYIHYITCRKHVRLYTDVESLVSVFKRYYAVSGAPDRPKVSLLDMFPNLNV